jgi:predicted ATP-grasp superfamily ATP-dependent carboligase
MSKSITDSAALAKLVKAFVDLKSTTPQERAAASNEIQSVADNYPLVALAYLDSMPSGIEARVDSLKSLRRRAQDALLSQNKASFL